MPKSTVDIVILVVVILLFFFPLKENFVRAHSELALKCLPILMLGCLVYPLLRGDWVAFMGGLPFCFCLLPAYRNVLTWAFQQKYPIALACCVSVVPMGTASWFLSTFFKDGLQQALLRAALFMAFSVMLAIVGQLASKSFSKKT